MITQNQLQFIANIAKIHCATEEHIQKLLESGVIEFFFQSMVPIDEAFRDYLRRCLKLENDTFSVNYAFSVEQMISSGRYASTKALHEYSVAIPLHNRGEDFVQLLQPEIIEFSRGTTLENAEKIVLDAGLRFATAYELLDFSAKYPKRQLDFDIIALGTPLDVINPYKREENLKGYLVAGSQDFSVRSYERDFRRVLTVITSHWLAPHLINGRKFLAVRVVREE